MINKDQAGSKKTVGFLGRPILKRFGGFGGLEAAVRDGDGDGDVV
jgi:hypothetical protein